MTESSLKPIKDIRFFERAEAGRSLPGHAGTLYPMEAGTEAAVTGARYAMKLAERGFRLRGFHHLYVTLNPRLPTGEVRVDTLPVEHWFRFVDVGLPLDRWPLERAEQSACLVWAATRALEHLSEVDHLDGSMLPDVEREVLEHGADLEITRLVKDTAAGTLRVTFKALPYGTPSPVYVEWEDRARGRSGKIELMRVKDFEDVFPLFGSASIARGAITLKPRASFRAGLTTRSYQTPIRVPISRVLEAGAGEPANE
jgi:hypothetical protein